MAVREGALMRDRFGRLMLQMPGQAELLPVVPVRAFPIGSPTECVSLMSLKGEEIAWIARLADLDATDRVLIEEDLTAREFVPEVQAIREVSSFATPSTWTIETDRGPTTLLLKGEEDIRRLGRTSLLIADGRGIQFLVRDIAALDRPSRKLLDRFL